MTSRFVLRPTWCCFIGGSAIGWRSYAGTGFCGATGGVVSNCGGAGPPLRDSGATKAPALRVSWGHTRYGSASYGDYVPSTQGQVPKSQFDFLPRTFSQSFVLVYDPTSAPTAKDEDRYKIAADSFRFV